MIGGGEENSTKVSCKGVCYDIVWEPDSRLYLELTAGLAELKPYSISSHLVIVAHISIKKNDCGQCSQNLDKHCSLET